MKNVVGFLSRSHGFDVLNSIIHSKDYNLIRVYTHKLNPKSQDPSKSIRSDYHLFEEVCKKHKIHLETIDSKNHEFTNFPESDFIIEVSWRYLIPQKVVTKCHIAAFGIHRGKLPEYAGAEPIKQALVNHDNEIVLSVHDLNAVIDKGEVFKTISHSISYDDSISFNENIEKIRNEITPKFSNLILETLSKFDKK